jgi:hypothetical protein
VRKVNGAEVLADAARQQLKQLHRKHALDRDRACRPKRGRHMLVHFAVAVPDIDRPVRMPESRVAAVQHRAYIYCY